MIDRKIEKGDVFTANLGVIVGSEQWGKRPVVIIQNNIANEYSPTVIVAPLTTIIKKTKQPTHIFIKHNKFITHNSIVLLEQIRTLDKIRLDSYLGKIDNNQITKIDIGLINCFSIDINSCLYNLKIGCD